MALRALSLVLSLAALSPAASAAQDDAAGIAFFEARIRPLLLERCSKCHGPRKQKASLRLDEPAHIRAGADLGPVVVPGDVAGSRMLQVVSYEDERVQMPPKGKLPAAEIALLTEWIERGAPMPAGDTPLLEESFDLAQRARHWSFQPIRDPVPPAVEDDAWPRTSADRFVLARLEQAGLAPAPPAARVDWLRRVTFDLIGLPPTPGELAAFEVDLAPGAEARVVDRLLAAPAFGETWARHWLDLVRYAETKGHEFDYPIANAWRYRDYVVRAFDADVPYDRFVLESLAGDLLEEPRPHASEGWDESVLGTGWWWLGEEMHSPVDIRADETNRLADQVDVLGKAFLGLTVACARCHDHKFDAITQRDYYALCGFPLSSPYRQVRYETREHNAALAAELSALRARHAPAVRRAVGEGLLDELEDLEALLLAAAGAAATPEPLVEPPSSFLDDPTVDLLVEDFEGDDWRGWEAEGDAFGARPLRRAECAQGDVGALGQGFVNTHNGWRDGELVHTDELTGRLTSPPFVLRRDWLHLLVGGGQRADVTCVQLLVDGEVVDQQAGTNNNRMRPVRFDLRALRGRSARLRVVDQWREGWGNIGVDHLVLSDREDPQALDVRLRPAALYARRRAAAREAARHGTDRARVERALVWLERAAEAGSEDPLALFARLARGDDCRAALDALTRPDGSDDLPEDALVRADYRAAGRTPWISDGPLWVRRDAGDAVLAPDAARPLTRVEPLGAATVDAAWTGLRAIDSGRDEAKLGYERAGRSLFTPSFELDHGRLFYLMRGKGRVYAAVDSYKLLHGPLHGALVRDLAAPRGYQWVEHDLRRYAGRRLHLEFSPRDDDPEFAVALVVEAAEPPRAGVPRAGSRWPDEADLAGAVAWAARGLRETARALSEGRVEARDTRALDWMLATLWSEGAPAAVESRTAAYRGAEQAARGRARLESRLAPALLDGSAVDERLLGRGNPHAAGAPVPRAFLTALDDTPVRGPGSGRRELALRLVDPSNPLVSRAWVNRLWHHLFGRGLAPTVDDLGKMGSGPGVHADLLDHLARRFTGELDWSTKALLRELVLSATYRQASRGVAAAEAADPANGLWHRMPVKRLTAEALRDAILAVSGDLDRTRLGPPVPIHLTEFLQGRGRPGQNGPLDGDRRRSLYLAVRRNFLVPMLAVFDFPVPSVTRGRRGSSNVPAQALTLLNDPFVHEQAQRWAASELTQHPDASDEELVEDLYLRALARPPSADERAEVAELLAGTRGEDRRHALSDVCHVLYNLKEFRHLR